LPDFQALLAQLLPEILIRAADRECADAGDDNSALTDAQRQKSLVTIDADILATARAESELVWQAQSRGMAVSHRENIDVRALLGVDCVVSKTQPPSDDGSHVTKYVGAPR
jgi:hypothetical protein